MTSSKMRESEKELLHLQQVDWSVDPVVEWHFAFQRPLPVFRVKKDRPRMSRPLGRGN